VVAVPGRRSPLSPLPVIVWSGLQYIWGRPTANYYPRPLLCGTWPWDALLHALYLLQLAVPEQLRSAVVQQHVQGQVVWGSTSSRDRTLYAAHIGLRDGLATLTLIPTNASSDIMSGPPRGHLCFRSVRLVRPQEGRWRSPRPPGLGEVHQTPIVGCAHHA
jgi:hypothetical protein